MKNNNQRRRVFCFPVLRSAEHEEQMTRREVKRKQHHEHTRCRKPKRQGSRCQTGKKLPVKVAEKQSRYCRQWHERHNRRMGG